MGSVFVPAHSVFQRIMSVDMLTLCLNLLGLGTLICRTSMTLNLFRAGSNFVVLNLMMVTLFTKFVLVTAGLAADFLVIRTVDTALAVKGAGLAVPGGRGTAGGVGGPDGAGAAAMSARQRQSMAVFILRVGLERSPPPPSGSDGGIWCLHFLNGCLLQTLEQRALDLWCLCESAFDRSESGHRR